MRVAVIPYETKEKIYRFKMFKGKKILDIGCGNGWVIEQYARHGAFCYGIDLTEKAINLSYKRLSTSGLQANLLVGDAQELPYPSEYFDLVSSMGVLHHVPNTVRALSEIHRVLKPEGHTLLMFYHKNSLRYRLLFPCRKIRRGVSMQLLINEFDGPENPLGKVFSRREVKTIMPGFRDFIFRVDWLMPSHYLSGKFWPYSMTRFLASRWGYFLYVWARKA